MQMYINEALVNLMWEMGKKFIKTRIFVKQNVFNTGYDVTKKKEMLSVLTLKMCLYLKTHIRTGSLTK